MKSGFDKLKGLAAISAMGVGLLGGGSARAATVSTPLVYSRSLAATIKSGGSATFRLTGIGTLSSTNGTYFPIFGISEHYIYAGESSAYNDAFDGVLSMVVDGVSFTNPDNTVDLSDNILTTDVVTNIVSGIDAQIQYSFHLERGDTSLGLIAALFTLTNTTASSIATTVTIVGELGSDRNTTIHGTSSGDLIVDDTDKWSVSSETAEGDPVPFSSDPVILITRYGSGANIVPTQLVTLATGIDRFENNYQLNIPANSTQRILAFIEAHKTNDGAIASAADFETLTALQAEEFFPSLTPSDFAEVVNYEAPSMASPDSTEIENDETVNDSSGAFGVIGLTTMFGLLSVFRRKK